MNQYKNNLSYLKNTQFKYAECKDLGVKLWACLLGLKHIFAILRGMEYLRFETVSV